MELFSSLFARIRSVYYRLRHQFFSLHNSAKYQFHPILEIGDIKTIFNSNDTAFIHYLYKSDFIRMRNLCRKSSKYIQQLNPSLIIDAGANHGVFSILINSFYVENIPTLCVEPDNRVFPFLKKSLILNKLTHCTAINAMLGETTCKKQFQENLLGSLDSRSADIGGLSHYTEKTVRCFSLDDLVAKHLPEADRERLLIKIDVQGQDIEVLKGASNLLKASKSADVIIEFDPSEIPTRNKKKIFELFQELGFKTIINLGESNVDWTKYTANEKIDNFHRFSKLYEFLQDSPGRYTNLLIIKE